jgi:hypothetical protein
MPRWPARPDSGRADLPAGRRAAAVHNPGAAARSPGGSCPHACLCGPYAPGAESTEAAAGPGGLRRLLVRAGFAVGSATEVCVDAGRVGGQELGDVLAVVHVRRRALDPCPERGIVRAVDELQRRLGVVALQEPGELVPGESELGGRHICRHARSPQSCVAAGPAAN